MFDGLYNYVDHAKDFEIWYYDWYDDFIESSRRTWSTDYTMKTHKKFLCMKTAFLEINHNKKRAYREHSQHQLLQHKKWKNPLIN
eukprot:3797389-Amphidinium_carterae.1